MRYFKGTIQLNPQRDYPLLKQVLHCGFVRHDQLWEFMAAEGSETRRDAFGRRVKRLVDHGFLVRHSPSGMAASLVYSLAPDGGFSLASAGQSCPGATTFFDRQRDLKRMLHAIELNNIHLTLLRSGLLTWWMSEIEVRSRNELTSCGYAKDYDAVVTLKLGSVERSVALEYERQAKADNRYVDIAARVQQERRLDRFLYLVADLELLLFMRRFFARADRRVYFALACEFQRDLLETRVVGATSGYTRLASALEAPPLPH